MGVGFRVNVKLSLNKDVSNFAFYITKFYFVRL